MPEQVAINPERLMWCCADYGVDPSALPAALGIAQKTIQSALEGLAVLSFKQLKTLASFFGRGVLFFLDPGPVEEEQVHTVQFRTIRNKRPQLVPEIRKLIERAEWQREVFLSLLEEVGDDSPLPQSLPEFVGMTPKEAAAGMRRWLGLSGRQDIESYRAALEAKGILVFRAQGYKGGWHWGSESPVLGFSLFLQPFPVIVLKRDTWETQQSFTMMHELGHLILHRAGSIDGLEDFHSHDQVEAEANQFAGHLLVPDQVLNIIQDGQRPNEVNYYDHWVQEVRRECGVSTEVVLLRLIDAGRLTSADYFEYRRWRERTPVPTPPPGGSREYRHREPVHIFGDRYVRTVLDAFGGKQITAPKASAYLDNLKLSDIHQLERHYAGV